jgi:hypothetical protein
MRATCAETEKSGDTSATQRNISRENNNNNNNHKKKGMPTIVFIAITRIARRLVQKRLDSFVGREVHRHVRQVQHHRRGVGCNERKRALSPQHRPRALDTAQ